MTDLTLADCRPEVLAFALLMERELRANDHKGGWKNDNLFNLLERAQEELQELEDVLSPGTRASLADWRSQVASEAADVANMVMMVADVSGALR